MALPSTPSGFTASPTSVSAMSAALNAPVTSSNEPAGDIASSSNTIASPLSTVTVLITLTESTTISRAVTAQDPATPTAATACSPTAQAKSTAASICPSKTATIAGAAVGSAVGAAILAAAVVWLLLSTRGGKRRGSRQSEFVSDKALPRPTVQDAHPKTLYTAVRWQDDLPQSADDATVRSWVKTIFDQVELHVEHFYEDEARKPTSDARTALANVDSRYLPQDAVNTITGSEHPTKVIEHCILRCILSGIHYGHATDVSLLPQDLLEVTNNVERSKPSTAKERDFQARAFSQWRVLTSLLRSSPDSDAAYVHDRDAKIERLVQDLDAAFQPWQSRSYSHQDRVANLVGIFQNASEAGIHIFAQPSTFYFSWRPRSSDRRDGMIVAVPGFLKISDETGRNLREPQVMIDPVITRC